MASVQVNPMSPWKQNTGGDVYQEYKPRPTLKSRHSSTSPRYVRTWSQEEESYLLEARKSRVPYKDIAARLNKTDLACRLHYHQMVVARKNAAPEDNVVTSPPQQYNASVQYHNRSESLPPLSTTVSHPTLILPAPIIREPFRSGSGAGTLSPSHRRAMSHPQTPARTPCQSPPMNGIRKNSVGSVRGGTSVDLNRIQELYRDFAPGFWSNIAAAYSHERPLSPSEIESAFWHGQSTSKSAPMSPNSDERSNSPVSWPSTASSISTMTSQGIHDEPIFSATSPQSIETSKERCSVNALLNN